MFVMWHVLLTDSCSGVSVDVLLQFKKLAVLIKSRRTLCNILEKDPLGFIEVYMHACTCIYIVHTVEII